MYVPRDAIRRCGGSQGWFRFYWALVCSRDSPSRRQCRRVGANDDVSRETLTETSNSLLQILTTDAGIATRDIPVCASAAVHEPRFATASFSIGCRPGWLFERP